MNAFLESITRSPTVRQFAKFAIVGASSTALDWGLHGLLYRAINGPITEPIQRFTLHLFPGLAHPDFDAAYTVLKAASFAIATLNGFYWNRRWTFRITDKHDRHRQLARFYMVNAIGLAIHTLVASQVHKPHAGDFNYVLSLASGTSVSMFWNFTGHRLWTFRRRQPPEDA